MSAPIISEALSRLKLAFSSFDIGYSILTRTHITVEVMRKERDRFGMFTQYIIRRFLSIVAIVVPISEGPFARYPQKSRPKLFP
jgi:hypothetical protein